MSRSKYVQSLLLAGCQTITFIVIHEVFWRSYIAMAPNFRRDVSWGLNARYAVMVFAVISFAGAIIGKSLLLKHQLLAQSLCVIVFAYFFLGSWSYTPYRTSFLLACGIVGFLGPFFLLRKGFAQSTGSSTSPRRQGSEGLADNGSLDG